MADIKRKLVNGNTRTEIASIDCRIKNKNDGNFDLTVNKVIPEVEKHCVCEDGQNNNEREATALDDGSTYTGPGSDHNHILLEVLNSERLDKTATMSKFRVYKNLLIFSFSYLLLFSAFFSFTNIQSTLYSAGSLGMIGLSILYIVFSAATLFATVYTTSRFTCKRITVVAMMTYALYVCTGFYPTLATVITASVLIGLGAANLWVVQQAYIAELAKTYAALTNRKVEDITSMFFGIFFGIFHTAQIWGNLVSSLVLRPEHNSNFTTSLELCGVDYCPGSLNMSTIQAPSQHKIYAFIGSCVGMSLISIIICLFITDVKASSTSSTTFSGLLKSVFNHIIRSRDQQLLIIPTMYRGLAQAFVLGDFTVAFVSCPLGVNYVGFVMIAYGVIAAVCSVAFGKLMKYTGHIPVLILAKYSTLFKGTTASSAYSTCLLVDSIGWSISLILSSWMCLHAKIILMMVTMTSSFMSFVVLERKNRNK